MLVIMIITRRRIITSRNKEVEDRTNKAEGILGMDSRCTKRKTEAKDHSRNKVVEVNHNSTFKRSHQSRML